MPSDVRLVTATSRNPEEMAANALLGSDIYRQLKMFPITIPPLRHHSEDIPRLARHFTKKHARKMDREIDTISAETMRALVKWHWPGNIREFESFIERAVILSPGPSLQAPLAELGVEAHGGTSGTLAEFEREFILRVFRETGGVISAAAIRLGVPRSPLNAMMKKLEISRSDL